MLHQQDHGLRKVRIYQTTARHQNLAGGEIPRTRPSLHGKNGSVPHCRRRRAYHRRDGRDQNQARASQTEMRLARHGLILSPLRCPPSKQSRELKRGGSNRIARPDHRRGSGGLNSRTNDDPSRVVAVPAFLGAKHKAVNNRQVWPWLLVSVGFEPGDDTLSRTNRRPIWIPEIHASTSPISKVANEVRGMCCGTSNLVKKPTAVNSRFSISHDLHCNPSCSSAALSPLKSISIARVSSSTLRCLHS